ncbi:nicotinate-nucleotide adenylyltransferase [Candidatus Thioglobus sp.]|uniref:nicotinate-nucleotide adenylyltransferase n=1 Tax=Candidatus Thioglobus sp. TaxID=2026721 RepID=UPI0026219FFF|nr:nicotinate-nucleotide adenylyltransferase [Candidatus Thioglobus sp.]MDG2395639.1 nicotinate-nucleotide adenylyltransferase [Candidatus Thioglobus sp.]
MIGFFGGSFDPIHLGHLNNAQQLKQQLKLSQLFLMPCHLPVHKNNLKFSTKQRLEMLEHAIQSFPTLEIDTREIKRQTDSYTIDSLKQINQEHPKQSICLIIGMDSFNDLSSWKDYQDFYQYCHLIVLERPGQQKPATIYNYTSAISRDELTKQATGLIYFAKTDAYDISSSQIRGILFDDATDGKMSANQSLAGLLPSSVINYLEKL